MARSRVAVVRTRPETVLADYRRAMQLAGVRETLDPRVDTALKINISWHFFYPGCSTTPWQLEGVIRGLLAEGFERDLIHACHNRTVVIDAHLGERENKQLAVTEAHGLRNVHLYEDGEEWVHIDDVAGDLRKDFLALDDVYPEGFHIPKRFLGENIIHLPTVKTHIFTTTTGRHEKRLRRFAERAPPLDAPGHPRDARRPADDPEEDPFAGCSRSWTGRSRATVPGRAA